MNFSKKLKEFVTLGSSNFISSVIFGLFWLSIATFLTKTDYGQLGFFIAIVNVASIISLSGVQHTIMVYEPKKYNIIPASTAWVLITSIVSAIVVFVLFQNFLVSIMVVGMTFFLLTTSALLSKEKYRVFSKYRLLQAVVTVIISIIFYQIFGINGILLGYFLSYLFILKELFPLLKNKKIEFSILKSKIGFMTHAYANRLSQVFLYWGDKLVIGTMFGLTMLASYHFAAQYFLLLQTIPRSMDQYLLPQEAGGQPNKKAKQFFIGLSCLVVLVSIFVIPYGVTNFLPKYQESIFPMQIMSLGIIPSSIIAIQNAQFMGKENSRIVFIGSVFQAATYFVLIIVLGQFYGLIGFAIGFVSAQLIRVIFYLTAGSYLPNQNH